MKFGVRLLKILLIAFAVMQMTMTPQPAMAKWCISDCDELTSQQKQQLAQKFFAGDSGKSQALSELVENANYGYCPTCSNNAIALVDTINRTCRSMGAQVAASDANATDFWSNKCKQIKQELTQIHQGAIDTARCNAWVLIFNPDKSANAFTAKFNEIFKAFLDFGQGTGCWFCPIFDVFFDVGNALATDIYGMLQDLFLAMIVMGAAFWLLWSVFQLIMTINGPNIGEFMTSLFKGLGLVMFITLILSQPVSRVTNLIVEPFALMGTAMSNSIMTLRGFDEKGNVSYISTQRKSECGSQFNQETKKVQVCSASDPAKYEGKAMSAETHDQMFCLLRRISVELVMGLALGATIVEDGFTGGALGFLPQFDEMLVGLLILGIYGSLYVAIPFKLFDILLRLCFCMILLPYYVACFTFKATRKFTEKGWQMFISCWIDLLALCVMITFIIEIINVALTGG